MKLKSESEVAQSCPTLSDPMDCSPPGSSIHGIFQARVLEWGALPSLLVYLKTGKVIKTTESLRNSHSQEEPKKIQQLNAMWCPQWNPDIGKGHWVNTKEI